MAREDPQLKLRLPEGLKDQVAEAAKRNNRSVNAEIVARLSGPDLSSEVAQIGLDMLKLGGEVSDLLMKEARVRAHLYRQIAAISEILRDGKTSTVKQVSDEIIQVLRAGMAEEPLPLNAGEELSARIRDLATRLLPSVPEKF